MYFKIEVGPRFFTMAYNVYASSEVADFKKNPKIFLTILQFAF